MSDSSTPRRIHPLLAGAAVSVIVASLVGIAAMTGLLPTSNGTPKPAEALNTTALASDASGQNNVSGNDGRSNQLASSQSALSGQAQSQQQAQQPQQPQQPQQQAQNTTPARVSHPVCDSCGVVASVRAFEQQPEQGSGLGAVAGALLGGVLGNQVGGGDGRKLATVAGAVGGGFAGNTLEKRNHTTTRYEVRVRLDNGHERSYQLSTAPEYREGDRVHIVNGHPVMN